MDTLTTVLFYVLAAVSVAGALATALAPGRGMRVAALLVVAAGLGALFADLQAGFAGLVVFISIAASALLLGGRGFVHDAREAVATRAHHAGGAAAALLFAALAYAAVRGAYHPAGYPGGEFGAAAVGRALLGRDALAAEAAAAVLTLGLVTLSLAARRRAR